MFDFLCMLTHNFRINTLILLRINCLEGFFLHTSYIVFIKTDFMDYQSDFFSLCLYMYERVCAFFCNHCKNYQIDLEYIVAKLCAHRKSQFLFAIRFKSQK